MEKPCSTFHKPLKADGRKKKTFWVKFPWPLSPKDPGSPSENGFMEPKKPMRFGGDEGHPLLIIWEHDDWCLGKAGRCWSSYRYFRPPSATGGQGPIWWSFESPRHRQNTPPCSVHRPAPRWLSVRFLGFVWRLFHAHGDVSFLSENPVDSSKSFFGWRYVCPWFLLGGHVCFISGVDELCFIFLCGGYVSGLETFGSQLHLQSLDLLYASCGLSWKKHPPGDSSRDLFWDGEWKCDPKSKVVGDRQL